LQIGQSLTTFSGEIIFLSLHPHFLVEPQNSYNLRILLEKICKLTTNLKRIYPIRTHINKEAATFKKILFQSAHFKVPQPSHNQHLHKGSR